MEWLPLGLDPVRLPGLDVGRDHAVLGPGTGNPLRNKFSAGTPGAEVCDGVDNDCDGVVDNGVLNACGGCAPLDSNPGESCGSCGGVYECTGTEALACSVDANVCGGCGELSNPLGADCSVGVGACAASDTYVCDTSIGDTVCNAVAGDPVAEVCDNGIDDDCDGAVDEGCASCADYTDKGTCNEDIGCYWEGHPRTGSCLTAQVCEPTETVGLGIQEDLFITVPRGRYNDLVAVMDLEEQLTAPLEPSVSVGSLSISLDDELLVQQPRFPVEGVADGNSDLAYFNLG